MTCHLLCTTPTETLRWTVRTGENARVGSSPWVEIQLPSEFGLLPEHFSISYKDLIEVQSLGGASLFIDGLATDSAQLHPGVILSVGECRFSIENSFSKPMGSDPLERDNVDPESELDFVWRDKSLLFESIALSDKAKKIGLAIHTPWDAIESFKSNGLLEDAVRLLAGSLETITLIAWTVSVLGRVELPANRHALELAQKWCAVPGETTRLSAEQAIQWTDSSNHWTWLLAAISWTGGSLTPQGSNGHLDSWIPISPPRQMVTSAIIAVMQLACCLTEPDGFRNIAIDLGTKALRAQHEKEIERATSRKS